MNKYNGDGSVLVLKLEFKDKQLKVTLGEPLKKALLEMKEQNINPIIEIPKGLFNKVRG